MGNKLSCVPTFESVMTRLIGVACRALEPAEEEIVCGDLLEAGEHGWLALRDVLSLVFRRRILNLEIALSWTPIGVLTIIITILLTLLAMRTADGSAIYLWIWINNSDWAILQNAGFWNTVFDFAPGLLLSYITLGCCSWTCGLLIGWSSRKTRCLSVLLLVVTVVLIVMCGLPGAFGRFLLLQSARDYNVNTAVFQGLFYRRVFPRAIELFFIMLPAWWGMRQSTTIRNFAAPARFLLLLLCIGVFGLLVGQNLVWSRIHAKVIWPLRYARLPDIAPLTVSVPILYLFLIIRQRYRLCRANPS